jgi:hypothetical protein
MTIATVDPVITHVVFVTELNGLLPLDKGACVIRGPLDLRQRPSGAANDKDGAKYAHLRKGVGTPMKNLRHCRSLSCSLNASTPQTNKTTSESSTTVVIPRSAARKKTDERPCLIIATLRLT